MDSTVSSASRTRPSAIKIVINQSHERRLATTPPSPDWLEALAIIETYYDDPQGYIASPVPSAVSPEKAPSAQSFLRPSPPDMILKFQPLPTEAGFRARQTLPSHKDASSTGVDRIQANQTTCDPQALAQHFTKRLNAAAGNMLMADTSHASVVPVSPVVHILETTSRSAPQVPPPPQPKTPATTLGPSPRFNERPSSVVVATQSIKHMTVPVPTGKIASLPPTPPASERPPLIGQTCGIMPHMSSGQVTLRPDNLHHCPFVVCDQSFRTRLQLQDHMEILHAWNGDVEALPLVTLTPTPTVRRRKRRTIDAQDPPILQKRAATESTTELQVQMQMRIQAQMTAGNKRAKTCVFSESKTASSARLSMPVNMSPLSPSPLQLSLDLPLSLDASVAAANTSAVPTTRLDSTDSFEFTSPLAGSPVDLAIDVEFNSTPSAPAAHRSIYKSSPPAMEPFIFGADRRRRFIVYKSEEGGVQGCYDADANIAGVWSGTLFTGSDEGLELAYAMNDFEDQWGCMEGFGPASGFKLLDFLEES